ncbi:caspase family protein [Rhizobium sp. 007]|uniref:caspase family protein n=1 Tax=Rhizobium sp. 007 TaxID=2785056 RepID=UPI0018906593|nr:caspase family protein [Rhizobium sp. 007]QPB22671.1 caspase family protein [Rhizobium sp. 007]
MLLGAASSALFATLVVTSPASAQTNYAVIVGVTEYPKFPKANWLVGPGNDATLVREYLTKRSPVRFEPTNVTLLADNVNGAGEPTRASILSTLDTLGRQVGSGDFVYIHFSGHGFQQPSDDSSETDGLDEIFLPKDTERWVDETKRLPNAIVDGEIGQKLDRIREKGAFIWAVFDTCNSGTATRAAPVDNAKIRKIGPEAVGMPQQVLRASERQRALKFWEAEEPDEATADIPHAGGLVAFFAAQSNETTPEMPLPETRSPIFGLFTYTLFSKLAENPNVTYRQLADSILQYYGSINRNSTTPLFEGDLDASVFGHNLGNFVPQWPIKLAKDHATVQAGLLDGLGVGTRLAIVDKPASLTQNAIGFVEVTSADSFSSQVVLSSSQVKDASAEKAGEAQTTTKMIRTLREIPPSSYVRLIERAYDFTLKVARPADTGDYPDSFAKVNELLDAIVADETSQLSIEIVQPGMPADLRLAVFDESGLRGATLGANRRPALWFLPESGEASLDVGRTPPSIAIQGHTQKTLRDTITRYLTSIYRATSLFKISQSSDYTADEIQLKLTMRAKVTGETVGITTSGMTLATPGDMVRMQAMNKTRSMVDMNIIYIGSDYSISHIQSERLQPSASFDEESLEFTETTYGNEFIVAVFTEARPLTRTLDLSFLAQKGLRSAMRPSSPKNIADLVQSMGFAATARAAIPVKDATNAKPRGSIMLFPIRTVPPS